MREIWKELTIKSRIELSLPKPDVVKCLIHRQNYNSLQRVFNKRRNSFAYYPTVWATRVANGFQPLVQTVSPDYVDHDEGEERGLRAAAASSSSAQSPPVHSSPLPGHQPLNPTPPVSPGPRRSVAVEIQCVPCVQSVATQTDDPVMTEVDSVMTDTDLSFSLTIPDATSKVTADAPIPDDATVTAPAPDALIPDDATVTAPAPDAPIPDDATVTAPAATIPANRKRPKSAPSSAATKGRNSPGRKSDTDSTLSSQSSI